MAWTDKYVDLAVGSGGSGTTGDPWGSYSAAITGLGTISGPTRVFVRGNGSISGLLTFNNAGTSGANPLRWIGCTGSSTTWTEIGNDASTAKPLLTQSTNGVDVSTAFQSFEGLAFTSTVTSTYGTFRLAAADCTVKRCRFFNTSASYYALRINGVATRAMAIGCYASVDGSSSSHDCIESLANQVSIIGCVVDGGDVGIDSSGADGFVYRCIAIGNGSVGINLAQSGLIYACTVINPGSHGIQSNRTEPGHIANCLIYGATGSGAYPIRYTTTATSQFRPVNCGWYNVTNNAIQGLVEDWTDYNVGLLGADPFVNAAGGDYSLTSAAKSLGWPGAFENTTLVSYIDLGAIGREEPAAGAGGGRLVGPSVLVG